MELHPILDIGDEPQLNLWYVISCADPPCPRVGQACVFDGKTGSLYVVGGADPSTNYNDIHRLNLYHQQWVKLPVDQLEERYEHCALMSSDKIYVFGGANKKENIKSMQLIDASQHSCVTLTCNGETPCPRTLHGAACDGDVLYVWGGGHQGAVPISDLQLHIFDTSTNTWTQPTVKGKLPSARHGHVMAVVDKNLYIHGGMAGPTFHKDMHAINTAAFSCSKVKQKGSLPCARAAHAACVHDKLIYMFGGVSSDGALDDMYCFNSVNNTWAKLTFDSPPPTPRLDHSMLVSYLPYARKQEEVSEPTSEPALSASSSDQSENNSSTKPNIIPVELWGSSGENQATVDTTERLKQLELTSSENGVATESIPVLLVFGGMDTAGNIFNDLLLYRLKTD